MNVQYAKFQKKFNSRTISRELLDFRAYDQNVSFTGVSRFLILPFLLQSVPPGPSPLSNPQVAVQGGEGGGEGAFTGIATATKHTHFLLWSPILLKVSS